MAATVDSFSYQHGCKISVSTIYSWKKEYDQYHDHGRIHTALAPKSRKPKRFRVSETDPRLIDEITRIRICENPIIGKAKLYHILEPFCKEKGIKMVSESTIGKIIARLKKNNLIPRDKRNIDVKLNGKTGKIEVKEIKAKLRKKKNRKPKEHVASYFGDIVQCDAIMYQIGNLKRYFVCCIDLHSRISYAKAYDTLNSKNATDCITEFERKFKLRINHVQTDNGLEYHKYFDLYLDEQNIKHYWNYPRSPKMNAFIERFNRTLEDEFIDWRLKSLRDLRVSEFNQLLTNYLEYYNYKRPHHSLQLMTPIEYLNKPIEIPECM